MRIAAAVVLLAVTAGQGWTASPEASISPEEAHAGCYHTQLRPCMISLGTVFWFDMDFVVQQIARRNELDVNGNTVDRLIAIDARVPGNPETIGIKLSLGSPAPNDEVIKTRLVLPESPEAAHTAAEYDRTRLYDVVSVVLGSRCSGLD